jgi:tRNA modification GTPase
MESRSLSIDRRRAVLVGPPNVGKSSLFNALLGRDAALVSHTAGTTRDYLVGHLELPDCSIELADTAGTEAADSAINQQAQSLREQMANAADLVLWCVESTDRTPETTVSSVTLSPPSNVLVIYTKSDLVEEKVCGADRRPPDDCRTAPIKNQKSKIKNILPVSARTGAGLDELRQAINDWFGRDSKGEIAVVASTAARCRQAIAGAQAATVRALAALDSKVGDDLIALDLRLALDALAQVVGAVYTDDILDRIFSRFCIGK